MSYAQLSDDLLAQLEAAHVSRDARLLYVEATVHCARALTDGVVTTRLTAFCDAQNAEALAVELVTKGFWTLIEDGFFVNDYLAHNRPRSEVELSKARNRERKERSRRHALGDHANCRPSYCKKAGPPQVTGQVTGQVTRDRTPTHPNPSHPNRVGMGSAAEVISEIQAKDRYCDDCGNPKSKHLPKCQVASLQNARSG